MNRCHYLVLLHMMVIILLWKVNCEGFLWGFCLLHLLSTLLSVSSSAHVLLLLLLLSFSPTKRLLIEHPALSFKLQGAYTVHLKAGGRSWRYQEAFENVLHTARGYKDAECPKNNNKEAFDRFMAFCTGTDACWAKISPQIFSRLNVSWTMWFKEETAL